MSIRGRQAMEKALAKETVKALLAAGYTVSVNNGEESGTPVQDVDSILGAMFATDDEYLVVRKGAVRCGWVRFVYGNDGYDVISDYTVNLEEVLAPINALADRLEAGDFTISFGA